MWCWNVLVYFCFEFLFLRAGVKKNINLHTFHILFNETSQSFPSATPTVKCITPPCVWVADIISWSSPWDSTIEVIHIKILLPRHMHIKKCKRPRLSGLLSSIVVNNSSGHRLNCGFWRRARLFLYFPSAQGHSFGRALPYHIKVEILLHPVGGVLKLFSHFHDVEGVQGVHYRGSLYAPCTRQKLKD